MNKKYFINLLFIVFSFSFISCGGSNSGEEKPLNDLIGIYKSTDYSKYAWNINPSIDSSFKSIYDINNHAHIHLNNTWNITKGDSVKVAIIDEGFDVNHPDYKDRIIHTYNVEDDSSNVSSQTDSHGTQVTGVIASKFLGVAPNVELILININLNDYVFDDEIEEAFLEAKKFGAKIINCSWGGSAMSEKITSLVKSLKEENINIIFASGNGDKNEIAINLDTPNIEDESESPYVLGVGATSASNDVTSYSNYGSQIDILAPGGGDKISQIGIISTYPLIKINKNISLNLINNYYTFTAGTSFAAPATSGVIALMLSVNPNLTPDEIRTILIDTADKVGLENGADYTINNFDVKRAYGKINASKAVQKAIKLL